MVVITIRAIMMGNSGAIARLAVPDSSMEPPSLIRYSAGQLGDDRIKRLRKRGGHVRRLQPFGDVAAHGDRRCAIETTQDRVFHADYDGSDV